MSAPMHFSAFGPYAHDSRSPSQSLSEEEDDHGTADSSGSAAGYPHFDDDAAEQGHDFDGQGAVCGDFEPIDDNAQYSSSRRGDDASVTASQAFPNLALGSAPFSHNYNAIDQKPKQEHANATPLQTSHQLSLSPQLPSGFLGGQPQATYGQPIFYDQDQRYLPPSSYDRTTYSSKFTIPPMPYTSFSFQQSSVQMSRPVESTPTTRLGPGFVRAQTASWDFQHRPPHHFEQAPPTLSSPSILTDTSTASAHHTGSGHSRHLSDDSTYNNSAESWSYQKPQPYSRSPRYLPRGEPVAARNEPKLAAPGSDNTISGSSLGSAYLPTTITSQMQPTLPAVFNQADYAIEYPRTLGESIIVRKGKARVKQEPSSPPSPLPPPPPPPAPLSSPVVAPDQADDLEWSEAPKSPERTRKSRAPNGRAEKRHVW